MKIPVYKTRTEAVEDNIKNIQKLYEYFKENIFDNLDIPFARYLLLVAYRLGGGLFYSELKKWSRITRIPKSELLLINLSYELAQIGSAKPFGCTSVALRDKHGEFAHIRNMDWDAKEMGRTTVLVDNDNYVSVTNPGMLGAVSGMVHGRFSITLNWAPPCYRVQWGLGPLFILQYILENIRTYDEAVFCAENTSLSAPAIFMIVSPEESCIVERTPNDARVRRAVNKRILVATNHYVTQDFKSLNVKQDKEVNAFSRERYAIARKRAAKLKRTGRLFKILDNPVTKHEYTIQQMFFKPMSDEYSVIAYDNNHLF